MNNIERKIERLQHKANERQNLLNEDVERLRAMLNNCNTLEACACLNSYIDTIQTDYGKLNEINSQIDILQDIL